ncbi:MAG: HDOD domain-containing protein, partial [Candidatus Zixiibacteriota bacterium]
MDNEVLKQIFDQQQELLSLPQTLVAVLEVVRDDSSSADDLAAVLSKDPALTAKILRIVNSAYYGGNRQIGTVKQAVMMIGHRQITSLVLSSSVYQITRNWQAGIDRVRFWRHSLETAIAARMIAEKIGFSRPEEMFVGGLLHDIGLLILEQAYPDTFQTVRESKTRNESLLDREENAWGTNHARVGQFLLEQWRLPEIICESVGRHHVTFTVGA